ncbi:MAG: SLBB domain-containing protein [Magnetococcus sp. DMHC-1]|nr:SLBB domain-containing protein [Magnetococcales bacterium]
MHSRLYGIILMIVALVTLFPPREMMAEDDRDVGAGLLNILRGGGKKSSGGLLDFPSTGAEGGGGGSSNMDGDMDPGQPTSGDQGKETKTDKIPIPQESALNRVHPARLPIPEPGPVIRSGRNKGAEIHPESTHAFRESRPSTPQALRQFGYDLFDGTPSSFAPVTSIPIPTNYVVGPGDSIQIQMSGKAFQSHNLKVNREGMVNFPGIGLIPVAGVTFLELNSLFAERIKSQLIGYELSHVSMGTLRSMRVFVLGDVRRPGSFTVNALSTMINALFASGGVTPMGSLRNIQLKRGDQVVTTLDLYDLLMRGDASHDTRLVDGDVIFVPSIGPTVGIEGEVHRPGIFELKNEKTVQDVLKIAGGFLPSAHKKGVQLERIQEGKGRRVLALDLGQNGLTKTRVQNGDTIRIQSVLEKMDDVVTLTGHVERSGPYEWRAGVRLTDIIPSPRLLQENPDLGYVLIRREVGGSHRWKIFSTRLDQALADPKSTYNIPLQSRDEILVLGLNEDRAKTLEPWITELRRQTASDQLEPVVAIEGNVRFPGIYPHAQGMHVSELLRSAAETLPGTDLDYALLVRVLDKDGRIAPISIRLRDILGNEGSPSDILVRAEDKLIVFASSNYFEEYAPGQSRKGLFFRDLKIPGQGGGPDRIPEKEQKNNPFTAPANAPPTRAEEFFNANSAKKMRGSGNSFYPKESNTSDDEKSLSQALMAGGADFSGRNAGGYFGRQGMINNRQLQQPGTQESTSSPANVLQGGGTGSAATASDAAKEELPQNAIFGQFNQRERFKQFRQTVTDLPAFMTGGMPKEDAKEKFSFLKVPTNSPELADHFYSWSRRTREGLLKPVLEQLQAQATFSQPSRIVGVSGMVRFPGRYPLEENMRISDLIRAGGWMAEPAYTLEAEITRFYVVDNKNREMEHLRVVLNDVLSGNPAADLELHPFDTLTIKPVPNWSGTMRVSIQGEVRFPGTYPVKKGETLKQLIERAGNLTEFAFPEGAIFLREDLKERERKEMEALANRLEMEIVKFTMIHARSNFNTEKNQGMAVDPAVLGIMMAQLKETHPQGRLAIDLPAILEGAADDKAPVADSFFWDFNKKANVSIRLRDGDQILLPPRSSEVTVLGEVNYPTSHQYRQGKSPEDYISLSGGFSSNADKDGLYIVKANGQVIPKNDNSIFGSAWFNMGSPDVTPGDTVVVPLKTDQVEIMQFLKEVSSILYNLTITTAAIKQLGIVGK